MAWDLYRDYIAVGAKHELNLDSMSRKVTTLAMITPHLTTFDTARGRIMNLLSNDAYKRFLSWEIYRELAATASGPGGHSPSTSTPSPTPLAPPRSSTKQSLVSTSIASPSDIDDFRRSSSLPRPKASRGPVPESKKCRQGQKRDIPMRELT